jgi:hypothetical protein
MDNSNPLYFGSVPSPHIHMAQTHLEEIFVTDKNSLLRCLDDMDQLVWKLWHWDNMRRQ